VRVFEGPEPLPLGFTPRAQRQLDLSQRRPASLADAAQRVAAALLGVGDLEAQ